MARTKIDQLIKKAEGGDSEAMYALAQCYRDGEGVAQDFGQFLDWLMRLRNRLGFSTKIKSLLSFEGKSKNALTSFVAWLQNSAADGQPMHMNFLAILYREGIGVEKDLKQWIEWLHEAIAAGDADAMYLLALDYRDGTGVEKDFDQYTVWLHKASDAGNADAMRNLAWAYREGTGVEKDLKQYIAWLHKASAAGDVSAMHDLAVAYRKGIGVPDDPKQAMCWFFRAAEGRHEFALNEIRRMYQSRKFATGNLDAEISWLTQAAVIEDPNLFVELALKHRERNQPGDHKWFHKYLGMAKKQRTFHSFILRSLERIWQAGSLSDALNFQLMDELFKLSRSIDLIKLSHLIDDNSKNAIQVAHFTTLEALHSMLPVARNKDEEKEIDTEGSRVLRLYNIAYMNDPQEGGAVVGHQV